MAGQEGNPHRKHVASTEAISDCRPRLARRRGDAGWCVAVVIGDGTFRGEVSTSPDRGWNPRDMTRNGTEGHGPSTPGRFDGGNRGWPAPTCGGPDGRRLVGCSSPDPYSNPQWGSVLCGRLRRRRYGREQTGRGTPAYWERGALSIDLGRCVTGDPDVPRTPGARRSRCGTLVKKRRPRSQAPLKGRRRGGSTVVNESFGAVAPTT
jgi:hypothetical protein